MVVLNFGWDDAGACAGAGTSERRYRSARVFLDTAGSIIRVPGRLVATLGINDLVVVDDGECLLVCSKERAAEYHPES
ncbi:MAG: hypothetical protein M0Z41_05680 [Peptococcaceae bacterium]|nr:hypothetical protein [Peptococcaceae bacterium]